MLSIHKVRSGGAYQTYLRSEYYLGDETPAEWFGNGARTVGLHGEVTERELAAWMKGFTLDGKKLVATAGKEPDPETGKGGHQCGWDLTFSAPKPFGVVWSEADRATRAKLESCHVAAVKEVLSYIEETGANVRVREDDRIRYEPCTLVAALFHHDRSRANDPQPHTHAFVLNVGVTEDGKTRALEPGGLYALKMTAGTLYRASLAHRLRNELGLDIEARPIGFTVRGVPDELVRHYSKRRDDVVAKLGEIHDGAGMRRATARAAERAALATRPKKGRTTTEDSRKQWHEVNREHGFTAEYVEALFGRAKKMRGPDLATRVSRAAQAITESQSYFSEPELLRAVADRSQDGSAGVESMRSAVRVALETGWLVKLGKFKGREQFTTQEMFRTEEQLLSDVATLHANDSHRVSCRLAGGFTAHAFPLKGRKLTEDELTRNSEQKAAVERLTTEGGAITLLSGMAGTGKTTVLRTCKEIWEKAGYCVVGAALAGVAAENLREKAKIDSDTLAKRLWLLDRGDDRFKLDRKTILVLDEAGMVGTRQLAKLTRYVAKAGAKLVLAGDSKQLQPIEAGGPFGSIARRIGAAVLEHVTRQKLQEQDAAPTWAREAVKYFSEGEGEKGLQLFADRGLVHVAGSRYAAIKRLVRDWEKGGGLERPKERAILAATNQETAVLNALCQRRRLRATVLGKLVATKLGRLLKGVEVEHSGVKERVLPGDRVLFTEKSRPLGIENGYFGTARGVRITTGGKVLSVKLDNGKKVLVPMNQYHGLRLGYAATTHKLQGATTGRAFVLLGGTMQDLHLSYVQGSRAVEQTRFYTDKMEAGDDMKDLARQMSQSREKRLAHDLVQPPPVQKSGQRHAAVGAVG